MTNDNTELIAEARGVGNWAQHETGPEGDGGRKTGPTLFARLVYALEAASLTADEDLLYVKRMEAERDAALAVIAEAVEFIDGIDEKRHAKYIYFLLGKTRQRLTGESSDETHPMTKDS